MSSTPAAYGPGDDTGPMVRIRWSEVAWYEAVIPHARLAEAVESDGQENGHPVPADLSELEGDPWPHGDLVSLLRELQDDEDSDDGADGLEITVITAVREEGERS